MSATWKRRRCVCNESCPGKSSVIVHSQSLNTEKLTLGGCLLYILVLTKATHTYTFFVTKTFLIFQIQTLTPRSSQTEGHTKTNGSIPNSRSIPHRLRDQKDTLLHVPDFMPPVPSTPKFNLDFTMSPRGTTSFEYESINTRKMEPGVLLSSTESIHSTASN